MKQQLFEAFIWNRLYYDYDDMSINNYINNDSDTQIHIFASGKIWKYCQFRQF